MSAKNVQVVEIKAGSVVSGLYRRPNKAAKEMSVTVIEPLVIEGKARLLCVADVSDLSDSKLMVLYAESFDKRAENTVVVDGERVEFDHSSVYVSIKRNEQFGFVQSIEDADVEYAIHAFGVVRIAAVVVESVVVRQFDLS